jgi:hypothetical protein
MGVIGYPTIGGMQTVPALGDIYATGRPGRGNNQQASRPLKRLVDSPFQSLRDTSGATTNCGRTRFFKMAV